VFVTELNWKKLEKLTLTIPKTTFKSNQIKSKCSRRSSRLVSPRYRNCSLYEYVFSPRSLLVNRRWTFSIRSTQYHASDSCDHHTATSKINMLSYKQLYNILHHKTRCI